MQANHLAMNYGNLEPLFFLLIYKQIAIAIANPCVAAPMSEATSEVLLLSNPFAVKRAYSSSATLELSIFTALVLLIPNVRAA